MRPPAPSLAAFDPTPEEEEKAERAKPLKTPLCLRCKKYPRMSASPSLFAFPNFDETTKSALDAAFLKLSTALTSERAGTLTRSDVERLRTAHTYLSRAKRGWYCKNCLQTVLAFSLSE